jgi:hypothetical protein|tara:strand:+ start:1881 stop:2078 length:198 start_codon:yes stop_codon:yes gene_type:complete
MVKFDNIDILIDYKKGGLTLEQAATKLSKSSGLTLNIARQYLKGINRDNIVILHPNKDNQSSSRK